MTFSYNTGQAWTREGTASEAFLISTWTRTPAATPPGSNSYDDMLLYAATPPGSKSYVNAGLSTPEGSQHLAKINIMSSDPGGVAAGVVIISPDTSDW